MENRICICLYKSIVDENKRESKCFMLMELQTVAIKRKIEIGGSSLPDELAMIKEIIDKYNKFNCLYLSKPINVWSKFLKILESLQADEGYLSADLTLTESTKERLAFEGISTDCFTYQEEFDKVAVTILSSEVEKLAKRSNFIYFLNFDENRIEINTLSKVVKKIPFIDLDDTIKRIAKTN